MTCMHDCPDPAQYEEYGGEAINPKHLSLYERWRGYGKNYNPEIDWEHKKLLSMNTRSG